MTVSVPRIEKLLAEETLPWTLDTPAQIRPGRDALICEAVNALPALIAAVKACEHAGVCKLCDRLVRIHGHRAGCPIAPFSFEEQA